MKKKTFWSWLLALGLFLWVSSGDGLAGTLEDVKGRGKLIAGVKTDFPPFGFLDKHGDHKGFDVDIAKVLAVELFGNEKAVEFVAVTSGNRIPFLTSKKVDVVVATMSITEERKKEVDFSIPYFVSGQMILVHGDSRITKYQDLSGKKVATIQGSTGDMAIARLVPTAERVKFERTFEALQALKERRVEAFVEDYMLIYDLVQENRGLKITGLQPFSPERYGLAVRKGDPEWLDFINATLTKMKETGEFDKLLGKWFGEAAKVIRRLYEK